jgi:hypothetical protein
VCRQIGVAAGVAVLCVAASASAKATFGLQLKLGGAVPVGSSAFVESTTILVEEDRGGGPANYPFIGDVHNSAGWSLSFGGTVRDWEVSATRHSLPYDGASLYYRGESSAELVGLDVDDADVSYRRLASPIRGKASYDGTDSLILWTIDVGQRW